jgi:ResB-like family
MSAATRPEPGAAPVTPGGEPRDEASGAVLALLAHAGSPQAALVTMALLAVAVGASVVQRGPVAWALTGALALLSAQLLLALVVHPALRRQAGLLVFHLGLLALVLAAAVGRLMALDGRFELTEGVPFEPVLLEAQAGRWHRDGLARLQFRHAGFDIDYAPGRKRGPTRNRVEWTDADGRPQRAVIGDHHPLVLGGYRLYTSPNKGFAPVLTWTPADGGAPQTGAIHLPSYPAHELKQSQDWRLPDGRTVWVHLPIDEALIDPAGPAQFRLPTQRTLVLRIGVGAAERRIELAPGASAELGGGRVTYRELRTWMGYRVSYDPSLPWLLGAALLAAAGLAVHYGLRFGADRRRVRAAAVAGALQASTEPSRDGEAPAGSSPIGQTP